LPAAADAPQRYQARDNLRILSSNRSVSKEPTCPGGVRFSGIFLHALESDFHDSEYPGGPGTDYIGIVIDVYDYEMCGFDENDDPIYHDFTSVSASITSQDLPAGALQMNGISSATLAPVTVEGYDWVNGVDVAFTLGFEATAVSPPQAFQGNFQYGGHNYRVIQTSTSMRRSAELSLSVSIDGVELEIPQPLGATLSHLNEGYLEIIRN
jgi:hypothetical protein